jgi:hypothetical protein
MMIEVWVVKGLGVGMNEDARDRCVFLNFLLNYVELTFLQLKDVFKWQL